MRRTARRRAQRGSHSLRCTERGRLGRRTSALGLAARAEGGVGEAQQVESADAVVSEARIYISKLRGRFVVKILGDVVVVCSGCFQHMAS